MISLLPFRRKLCLFEDIFLISPSDASFPGRFTFLDLGESDFAVATFFPLPFVSSFVFEGFRISPGEFFPSGFELGSLASFSPSLASEYLEQTEMFDVSVIITGLAFFEF